MRAFVEMTYHSHHRDSIGTLPLQTQGPLATWVEKECAGVLLQHLLLGFELGVYAPHEHCMLFWYALSDITLHCNSLSVVLHMAC